MPANAQFVRPIGIFDEFKRLVLFRYLFTVFFIWLSVSLPAQQVKRYSFLHHGPSEGLGSNEVNSTAQDETGYIWIATANGLQRFDGLRYKTFRTNKNDASAIPHNFILQVLFDKKKNLWITTGDGKVGIFDTKNFTYHEMKVIVKDEIYLQQERKLILDQEGNLIFLLSGNAFVTWSEKNQQFSAAYNFIPLPEEFKIFDLAQQPWLYHHTAPQK